MKIRLLLKTAPLTSIAALVACGGPIEGRGAPPERHDEWTSLEERLSAEVSLEERISAEARVSFVDPPSRFDEASPSLEALGREILAALASGDGGALERLRLTEREHNEVVWPELPASAPNVNFPVDYAWLNIQNRSRRALSRLLDLYPGRTLRFESVDCRGKEQRFKSFEVLTDCYVVFKFDGQEAPREAQIFKDVLIRGGDFKIFRYYDGRPEPYRGGA